MPRFLYITPVLPSPGSGAGQRTLACQHALSRLGDVDILLLKLPLMDHQNSAQVPLQIELIPGSNPGRLQLWLRQAALSEYRPDRRIAHYVADLHRRNSYDAFFCHYHYGVVTGCAQLGPSYMDLDDIPTEYRPSRIPLVDARRRRALDRALAPFRAVFVTKQADVSKVHHPNVSVLPCISTLAPEPDAPHAAHHDSDAPAILFVGSLSWAPNHQAAAWFVEQCLPGIRQSIPSATLHIAGSGGESLAHHAGVQALGFVDDLAAEYHRASMVICPVLTPSGANIKLAEAAGFGCAIVATSIAARGFDGLLTPGRDLLVADNPQDFANACVRLLRESSLREKLGASAMASAAEKLSQSAIDAIIAKALGMTARSPRIPEPPQPRPVPTQV